MARHWKIAIAILAVLVALGLLSFPGLLRSVLGLRRATLTEEQARRAIVQPAVSTPSDTKVQAQLFWASATAPGTVEPAAVELPLSADPAQRCKQLVTALIERVPSPAQRTLPGDAELLQFYLLPDGTAVADFSDVLATETPSGILSEQMVVDSLTHTLAANVPGVTRLKILIRGEEADTLAGHLDLTGFFPVALPAPADSAPTSGDANAAAPPSAASLAAPAANPPTGSPVASTPH